MYKAFLLYRCIIFKLQKYTIYKLHKKYTVILYYYSMFYASDGAWFTFWSRSPDARNGTSVQSTPRPPFWVRYRVRQNAHFTPFSPIPTTSKITSYHPKHPSNPWKIRLQSNSIKIFKKSIQIIQKEHPSKPNFTQQKSSISRNPIIKKSPSHRTHQNSHHKSKHLTPKFGIWSGFYLPAKIHNIKKHKHNQ